MRAKITLKIINEAGLFKWQTSCRVFPYNHRTAEIIENAFGQLECKFAMVNSKINRQKVITNKRQSKSRRAQIFAPKVDNNK